MCQNFKIPLKPICLDVNKIKNYNHGDKFSMVKLLVKTNCIFCVDIFYNTDDVNNKNSVSVKNNVISKNDSLRKVCYGEGIDRQKKIMRGIHIKNFSKIFNVNLSQLRGKTERIVKKK